MPDPDGSEGTSIPCYFHLERLHTFACNATLPILVFHTRWLTRMKSWLEEWGVRDLGPAKTSSSGCLLLLHPSSDLQKAGQGYLRRDPDLKTGAWHRADSLLFTFLRKWTTLQVLPVLRLVQYMENPFNFSIYRKLYSFQVEKKASLHTYPLVSYLSLITERPQI